ncbi:MAG: HAMP domain-containing histidine kinase [Muribaculaceae bacterium]|nr:HAMP domain-containing histidine kinase [Muribaculaceae bacterium]
MTGKVSFFILTAVVILWGALTLFGVALSPFHNVIFIVISLILLSILYRSTTLPLSKVISGLDLLKSQDTANRLSKVGQRDADSIVSLFNSLMQSLRDERLKVQEQDHLINMLIHTSSIGVAILNYNNEIAITNDKMALLMGKENSQAILGKKLTQLNSALANRLNELSTNESKTMRIEGTSVLKCTCSSFIRNGFPIKFYIVELLTEEIIKTEKSAYGRVIRTMAHEVNNTISGLVTVLDIITAIHPKEPEITEVAQSAIQRCSSLAEFVKSYSDVMKIPQPIMQPVDINELIISMTPFLESIVGKNAKLVFELSPNKAIINIDKVLIEQTIVNIVKNSAESIAIKSNEDGIITISTSDAPVQITITDNGNGIPDDVSDYIFTPFFTTKRNGHGLGLMFVNETLRNHNCDFKLSSSKTTGLTRFSITFPQNSK